MTELHLDSRSECMVESATRSAQVQCIAHTSPGFLKPRHRRRDVVVLHLLSRTVLKTGFNTAPLFPPGASKKTQQIKALATEPSDLCSVFGSHVVEN